MILTYWIYIRTLHTLTQKSHNGHSPDKRIQSYTNRVCRTIRWNKYCSHAKFHVNLKKMSCQKKPKMAKKTNTIHPTLFAAIQRVHNNNKIIIIIISSYMYENGIKYYVHNNNMK